MKMCINSYQDGGSMLQRVLLVQAKKVQHYRRPIYAHLSDYLRRAGYELFVLSDDIERKGQTDDGFAFTKQRLNVAGILRYVANLKPKSVILHADLKSPWLFPVIIALRTFGIKVVYWGHGINLQQKEAFRRVYSFLHGASDAILLYADHLREHVKAQYQDKTFVANNTLNIETLPEIVEGPKEHVLRRYGIDTLTNVIFVGRVQQRKRILDLVEAFAGLESDAVGLILIGPDPEGILRGIDHPRIYKLGPLYGHDCAALQAASSLFCIPGTVGLGIVDAFFYGLPLITEDVEHSPEIMYLKDGYNGFMVSRGDVMALRWRIKELVEDSEKLTRFSHNARATIMAEGHIDRFCEGFVEALNHVNRKCRNANDPCQPYCVRE